MKYELEKLDAFLQEKRPDYYRELQQSLTEEEIVNLEKKYGIKLPEDLRELYKWKNGQLIEFWKGSDRVVIALDLKVLLLN